MENIPNVSPKGQLNKKELARISRSIVFSVLTVVVAAVIAELQGIDPAVWGKYGIIATPLINIAIEYLNKLSNVWRIK